jgi:phosphate transport system substrate-binding protein
MVGAGPTPDAVASRPSLRSAPLMRRMARALALVGALAAPFACSAPGGDGATLQGSGATFPAPIYKRWFLEYYQQVDHTRVNYSPIGSGAGIRQFTSGLVSFGASDAGMSKKEIAKLPADYGGVLLLPMTAGCIVLSYNVPGVTVPIRLSRQAYVDIFLRHVTKWNDPQIVKDNPGVSLPDQDISVVTRADSSGTTYVFTTHMAAVAKSVGVEWAPGVDKSVHWPESIAAQGNDGVAALVQLTPGAIAYIEFGYAELAHLPMAALENRAHEYVVPDREGKGAEKALEGADIPEDLQIKVADPTAPGAYPIATYTWMLLRKHYPSQRDADAIKALVRFCLDERQQGIAKGLGYVPLPSSVATRLRAELEHIDGAPASASL